MPQRVAAMNRAELEQRSKSYHLHPAACPGPWVLRPTGEAERSAGDVFKILNGKAAIDGRSSLKTCCSLFIRRTPCASVRFGWLRALRFVSPSGNDGVASHMVCQRRLMHSDRPAALLRADLASWPAAAEVMELVFLSTTTTDHRRVAEDCRAFRWNSEVAHTARERSACARALVRAIFGDRRRTSGSLSRALSQAERRLAAAIRRAAPARPVPRGVYIGYSISCPDCSGRSSFSFSIRSRRTTFSASDQRGRAYPSRYGIRRPDFSSAEP